MERTQKEISIIIARTIKDIRKQIKRIGTRNLNTIRGIVSMESAKNEINKDAILSIGGYNK
jgi:hypothetical protein